MFRDHEPAASGLWRREEADVFAEGSEWNAGVDAPLCESCGEESATVHVIRIDEGAVTHTQLCATCAEGIADQKDGADVVLSLPASLQALLGMVNRRPSAQPESPLDAAICAVCGTTVSDLVETGMVGCANCYQAFSGPLRESLEQTAEGEAHEGKVPSRRLGDPRVGLEREILRLRRMLEELVESERFEEAAGVRDRLAELGESPA
jgi:protein arginine kinase activator